MSDDPNNIAFITPIASWEIDFWGKFRRANESARAQLIASEYGLRSVQIALISGRSKYIFPSIGF